MRRGPDVLTVVATIRQVEIQWLATCAIAEVKDILLVSKLEKLLQGAGFSHYSVKYLGALRVLVECTSVETVEKLVSAGVNQLKYWLSWTSKWDRKKEEVNTTRVAWLNIRGVSLHAWHARTFE